MNIPKITEDNIWEMLIAIKNLKKADLDKLINWIKLNRVELVKLLNGHSYWDICYNLKKLSSIN